MIKCNLVYALFLTITICTTCKGQSKTDLPKDNTKSETKEVITSTVPNNITRTIKQDRKGDHAAVYQLDVEKSKLFWKAPKNRHNGFILFNSGALSNFTAGRPTRGTFSINMNSMSSIDEASAARRKKVDDELRNENFFAVSKYPVATIAVSKILPEPNRTSSRVYGELTIKEVTKPIEFTTIMKQSGNTITATADINISRAHWNIDLQRNPKSWNPFDSLKDHLVDDEIQVNLELVFTKVILQ